MAELPIKVKSISLSLNSVVEGATIIGPKGEDAVNPFKGWWNSLADLKAAITATHGDYAYIFDASPATTASIYVYSASASGNKYWADSGHDVDASAAGSFASGQTLNTVNIIDDTTTGGANNVLSAEQGKQLRTTIDSLNGAMKKRVVGSALMPYATLEHSLIRGSNIDATYIDGNFSGQTVRKYNVSSDAVAVSAKEYSSSTFYVVYWVDSNGDFIGRDLLGTNGQVDSWTDEILNVPTGATQMWMNVTDALASKYVVKPVTESYYDLQSIADGVEGNAEDIAALETLEENTAAGLAALETSTDARIDGLEESMTARMDDIEEHITHSDMTELSPIATVDGHFINGSGADKTNARMMIKKYSVTAGDRYAFSAVVPIGYNMDVLIWINSSGAIISQEYRATTENVDIWTDEMVTAPAGAVQLWMNTVKSFDTEYVFKTVELSYYDFDEWEDKLAQTTFSEKSMKVVVKGLNMPAERGDLFYIRTKYNDTKDIIVSHMVNNNNLITFNNTYLGSNTLSDSEIMVSGNIVSAHADSTGPLNGVEQYWHLFAQHGYPIPCVRNTVGMDANDIGAVWEDQLNRKFEVGNVTTNKIFLLPEIYQSGGHNVRDWHSKSTSDAIVTLSHVSGGAYTSDFTVSDYNQVMLYPIMERGERRWLADGKEITTQGTYYCDSFSVSESQVGYDPATINDWFGGESGGADLDGAEVMAKFTWSYNYFGAQCCVNTTIDIRREVECQFYGATQQQFFYDMGDYKAMFMVPKAKAQYGIDIDTPFNYPDSSSGSIRIYRSSSHLKDVDDQIDRMIGMLQNGNDGTHLIGMAAGLSLVSGDTIKSKRNQNCLVGSSDTHYTIGIIYPPMANKFYIAAFNASPFESNDYYFPTTFFKEVNFYVSYFDPDANIGQVYWYKDGNQYVIYCHCQEAAAKTAINVPIEMEGLSLSVVEKTSDASLLTDRVQNGKFFVSYASASANYIVLKTN